MNKYKNPVTTSSRITQFCYWLSILALIQSGNVWSECTGIPVGHHEIDFDECNSQLECTYALQYDSGNNIAVPSEIIQARNLPAPINQVNLSWALDGTGTCTAPNLCLANGQCLGVPMVVSGMQLPFGGTDTNTGTNGANGCFVVTATHPTLPPAGCSRKYKIHISSSGGGWGDPHITTVDGVHYDFQSAGEFIALRGDGLEIQTRQTAVSKQGVSGANAYTGIASCVSIYTAVAARVGAHRVTIQPNLSGEPDPSGMQVRVDGVLRTLGPDGIDLTPCNCDDSDETPSSGRIVKAADDKGIEIRYVNGTKLVVTPAWWESQQKWYLNINVYDTTASEGIMGRTRDNWLPALWNGTSVGPKAEDMHERYEQLYETFADSWRVNSPNSEINPSLFDYAPGTSTADFTLDEWPRKNPANCLLEDENEPVAEPVDESVAEEHCRDVEDENNRANCIFDVRETGHTGFADAYVRAEQVTPGATQTSLSANKASSRSGTPVTFTAVVMRKASTIAKVSSGSVQFILDGTEVGDPLAVDTNGNTLWNTSSLSSGSHVVEARFIPSGFGEQFRASSSKINHAVCRFGSADGKCENILAKWWFWLLIILLILLLIWLKPRFLSSK